MRKIYRFQVGDFECIALRDNSRVMQVQEIFPGVPPAELTRAMRAHGFESDEMTVGYNCLYVYTGEKHVLVDTGSGQGELVANLQSAGIRPADIDTIIITHGDGDHIGGIGDFPTARFALTSQAWELWTSPAGRARMVEEFIDLFRANASEDELAETAERRAAYGRDVLPGLHGRVDLVEPETEFLPGLRLIPAPGHRSDHTAVEIRSGGARLLHVVDGLRHPLQATYPHWTAYIDSYPQQTAATNKRLLERAATHDALIFGAHLTFPGLGRLRQADSGWIWETIAP